MATDEQIISGVNNALENWALGDIFKAVHAKRKDFTDKTPLDDSEGALRGAFILCTCLIDAMACYRYAKEAQRSDFKKFVKDYMGEKYNGIDNDLYFSLRCGLVHNYQTKNVPGNTKTKYKLTHNDSEKHLKTEADGIWLNLQNIIKDIEMALKQFFNEVNTAGSETRTNTLNWATEHGWLGVKPITKSEAVALKLPETIVFRGFDTSELPTSVLCYGPSGNITPQDLQQNDQISQECTYS